MSYITENDYLPQIKNTNLAAMVEENSAIRVDAEAVALSTIKNYLNSRYDIDAEFTLEDESRNRHLVQLAINITLYTLHQRLPNLKVNRVVKDNYDETITFLERAADGKVELSVARRQGEAGESYARFRWSSAAPRSTF